MLNENFQYMGTDTKVTDEDFLGKDSWDKLKNKAFVALAAITNDIERTGGLNGKHEYVLSITLHRVDESAGTPSRRLNA